MPPTTFATLPLPPGIRSRFVPQVNGLTMHLLEAGFETQHRPCVLLLHGFPELAYSWRKVMLPLATAGFHIIAPDQRGYGRTTGWDSTYDGDLEAFRVLNTREANANMHACPQGVHAFLRAYYHMKSADWQPNTPFPLHAWRADELAKMPTYYIMALGQGMAETVAPEMPSAADIAACTWFPDEELAVYSTEYSRTGFQGGLQWYRCATGGKDSLELQLFSGRTLDVPSMFMAGKSDWGVYQRPGNFERMQNHACTAMRGCHLLDGAGHWVQQEQPERVSQ